MGSNPNIERVISVSIRGQDNSDPLKTLMNLILSNTRSRMGGVLEQPNRGARQRNQLELDCKN